MADLAACLAFAPERKDVLEILNQNFADHQPDSWESVYGGKDIHNLEGGLTVKQVSHDRTRYWWTYFEHTKGKGKPREQVAQSDPKVWTRSKKVVAEFLSLLSFKETEVPLLFPDIVQTGGVPRVAQLFVRSFDTPLSYCATDRPCASLSCPKHRSRSHLLCSRNARTETFRWILTFRSLAPTGKAHARPTRTRPTRSLSWSGAAKRSR